MTSAGTITTPAELKGLELNIRALQSLLSEYHTRTQMAEQMCSTLLNEKIPPEALLAHVVTLMGQHSEVRATERAVQQQALLQSLHMALEQVQHLGTVEEMRTAVNNIAKSLTLSLGSMNPSSNINPSKENQLG